MVTTGEWYKSRRGYLIQIESVKLDGSAVVVSHATGNKLTLDKDHVNDLTPAEAPDTSPGLAVVTSTKKIDHSLYARYPHIVSGSIYRVKDTSAPSQAIRRGKISIKGSTRCKIRCETPGCKNERDIKVQDAFQVKKCLECAKKVRRKKLDKMLKRKGTK